MSTKNNKNIISGIIILIIGILLFGYFGKSLFKKEQNDNLASNTNNHPPLEQTTEQPVAEQVEQTPVEQEVPAPTKLGVMHGKNSKEILRPIPSEYTTKDEQIHHDVYEPLLNMIHAAKKDGINLTVVSAYRSYDRQKQIWERKWGDTPDDDVNKALEILNWSSFPGTSRHHWGTDVDFNSVDTDYWTHGTGLKTYEWLQANAASFGFCQTYGKGRNHGYNDEAWHWSHIPTAKQYYAQVNHPQTQQLLLNQGVKGSTALAEVNLLEYITGISDCPMQ